MMVGFRSDNPTGSAWVNSGPSFRLPRRSESLESQFLAGNYKQADQRRQRRLSQAKREYRENQPRTWTAPRERAEPEPVPVGKTPRSYEAPRQAPRPGETMTVGRLRGVTVDPDQSFLAKAGRNLRNFSNSRLAVKEATFEGASGFSLDGVELTQQEYDAWMRGDPDANALVVVNGGSSQPAMSRPAPVIQTPQTEAQARQNPARQSPARQSSTPSPQPRTSETASAQEDSEESSGSKFFWIITAILLLGSGIFGDIIDMIASFF